MARAKFDHLVLSYSTEGLMTAQEIERILKSGGWRTATADMIFLIKSTKAKFPAMKAI